MKTAPPAADRLIDEILGYRKAKVLLVAAYLDCFSRLERPRTAAAVARGLRLDPRGAEILLDALVAMGYLLKDGALYRNAPVASRHLVPGRRGYLGDNLKYQEMIWDAWSDLRRSVRRGRPARPLEHWLLRHRGFTREYIRGMDDIAREPAREIAALVEPGGARELLDVGAGPGTYSAALQRRNRALRATLFDLPSTLRVTRDLLARRPGAAGRTRLRPGNYRSDPFGREEFDLVLLSHVTHDEDPATNRRMLAKARRALRPGGRVLIHDFMLEKCRTAPEFGALFSVHMLAYTAGGRTYTEDEYRRWLSAEGFSGLRSWDVSAGRRNATRLLLGVKRG
jgi:SAM-dependent methyltransferase